MNSPMPHTTSPQRLVIITGISGAGRSVSLSQLEDFGFEAVDNLPARFIPMLIDNLTQPLALAIDVRNRDFAPQQLLGQLQEWRQRPQLNLNLLFLDCADNEIIARYSKTKRRHPMGSDHRLVESIQRERALLMPLRTAADYIIDTTGQSIWQHRERLKELEIDLPDSQMRLRFLSFSYGHGLPRDADLVFDVRFLHNPHYQPTLQAKDGTDAEVAAYVAQDEAYHNFCTHIQQLLTLTLSRYQQEGKAYLSIAFGCTGGRHRSVACAEAMEQYFRSVGYQPQIFHRDTHKN